MDRASAQTRGARWGGRGLLSLYLLITIPVALDTWGCAGWRCSMKLNLLISPVSMFISGLWPIQTNLVGIIGGMLVTGSIVYGLGRTLGRHVSRVFSNVLLGAKKQSTRGCSNTPGCSACEASTGCGRRGFALQIERCRLRQSAWSNRHGRTTRGARRGSR